MRTITLTNEQVTLVKTILTTHYEVITDSCDPDDPEDICAEEYKELPLVKDVIEKLA